VLRYTVRALPGVWGKNYYYARPQVDGADVTIENPDGGRGAKAGSLSVYAFTKEDFSSLTPEEKKNGSRPVFTSSSYSFGRKAAGSRIIAEYSFTNSGKQDFIVYKVDADAGGASVSDIPVVAPSQKGSFTVNFDTAGMPKGETLVIVTLTTNSPSRPIVNLFITGWLD